MIRVAVAGAAGRMGKTLIEAIGASDNLLVVAGFEHADHPRLGEDLGLICGLGPLGVTLGSDPAAQTTAFDVVIDFTTPSATLTLAEGCARHGNAMVVGTTGFDEEQLLTLQEYAQKTAIFVSPNMSVGVNLSMKLIELAAKALGDEVDVEVIEAHHKHLSLIHI